jgi:hypothetical protein
MAVIKTKIHRVHDDACVAAEAVRQGVVVKGVSQSAARSAEITFYQQLIASAVANGLPSAQFHAPLRDLGVPGF